MIELNSIADCVTALHNVIHKHPAAHVSMCLLEEGGEHIQEAFESLDKIPRRELMFTLPQEMLAVHGYLAEHRSEWLRVQEKKIPLLYPTLRAEDIISVQPMDGPDEKADLDRPSSESAYLYKDFEITPSDRKLKCLWQTSLHILVTKMSNEMAAEIDNDILRESREELNGD